MKRILILVCVYSTLCAGLFPGFKYGRAVKAAQSGDWVTAERSMQTLLVDNPNNVELLYDLGVACYNNKKFDTAAVYFEQVAKKEDVKDVLRERALFNLANTRVAQRKLDQAIEHLHTLLELNPANDRAKYNLDQIKKMLEEQKKEEQKQDSSEKQNNQNKNQASKDNDDTQSGDCTTNSDDGKNSDRQQKEDNHKQSSSQSQKNDFNNESKQNQDHNSSSDQVNQKQPSSGKEQDNFEQEQKAQGANKPSSQKKSGVNDKQNIVKKGEDIQQKGNNPSGQVSQQGSETSNNMSEEDRLILELMEWQEKQDAQANKDMMRRSLNKNGAKDHGRNRW